MHLPLSTFARKCRTSMVYFTLVTTRDQRSILRLTTNPTRGQHHSNGTTKTSSKICYSINNPITFVYNIIIFRTNEEVYQEKFVKIASYGYGLLRSGIGEYFQY